MSKGALWLFAAAVLAFGAAYLGSPYWAARSLKEAASEGDADRIDAGTDMAAVKDGLKAQLSSALLHKMNDQPGGATRPLAALGALIMPALIDRIIDTYVTAEGLATIMKGGNPASSQSGGPGNAPEVIYDSEYIGLDRFRVQLHRIQSGDMGPTLLFERREIFDWKLIRIELPDSILKDQVSKVSAPATTDGSGNLPQALTGQAGDGTGPAGGASAASTLR